MYLYVCVCMCVYVHVCVCMCMSMYFVVNRMYGLYGSVFLNVHFILGAVLHSTHYTSLSLRAGFRQVAFVLRANIFPFA